MNQHKSIARRLLPLAVAALFCSLFFTLIQCQITIGSKQQELAAVREQLSASRPKTKSWDAHWPMAKTRLLNAAPAPMAMPSPMSAFGWI